MSFISYVIAWTIIIVLFTSIMKLFERFIVFLRDKTPLGNIYREKKKEEYKEMARYVASEMAEMHFFIKEFEKFHPDLNDEVEVEEKKEGN